MTSVRLWLSHDGYRDPDDNLGLLVGAAQARTMAKGSDNLRVAGVVFGDTKDGAQFKMLKPQSAIPAALDDGDARYDDGLSNRNAAGNYAFYKEYGSDAIRQLAPGWDRFDLLAEDAGGTRAWNYDPAGRSAISKAARGLVDDIVNAVAKGGGDVPNAVVAYSAGGGAHVPAEAIAYLRNQGYSEATLVRHFAVIQHGDSNWWVNQEPEATAITRPYTIPLSEQDPNVYANGDPAPGLKALVRDGVWLSGIALRARLRRGDGGRAGPGAVRGPAPASAIPHDDGRLRRGKPRLRRRRRGAARGLGRSAEARREHRHRHRDGASRRYRERHRERVIYDDFDWRDARALMNGPGTADQAALAFFDWG